MKLYVFNPEHDIALAHGTPLFTAPRAGRQLRVDLGFIPVLWAEKDGVVWVDNPNIANLAARQIQLGVSESSFVTSSQLRHLANQVDSVEPWGWDAAICHEMLRLGISQKVLPTSAELEEIRNDSHRNKTKVFLEKISSILQNTSLVGESVEVKDKDGLFLQLAKWSSVVLKAPWSSSGRGVRMVCSYPNDAILRWAMSVIRHQGCLMIEPMYDKILDFALEFCATRKGVSYVGLSLFTTSGSAYTGNLIADECEKVKMLERYIDMHVVNEVRKSVLDLFPRLFPHFHYGSFGIDMMVVRADDGSSKLHPCVEINFRKTMGHVSIALGQNNNASYRTMNVHYKDGSYHLCCR